jgi:hypothetical protein
VVFHTGQRPWNTNRALADLLAAGECQAWAPQWPARFCDLAERQPETLLQAADAWWQAMAVVRAEWADAAEFTVCWGDLWASVPRVPTEKRSREFHLTAKERRGEVAVFEGVLPIGHFEGAPS